MAVSLAVYLKMIPIWRNTLVTAPLQGRSCLILFTKPTPNRPDDLLGVSRES